MTEGARDVAIWGWHLTRTPRRFLGWNGGAEIVRIQDARPRERVAILGRISEARRITLGDAPALVCTLEDPTGRIALRFLGRDEVNGVAPGRSVIVEGTIVRIHRENVILNPLISRWP